MSYLTVLIHFSLTVKAATLVFIFGHGSAISSAKEGKTFGKALISFWGVHFIKVLTIYTLTSHALTLKAHATKSRMFLLSAETF